MTDQDPEKMLALAAGQALSECSAEVQERVASGEAQLTTREEDGCIVLFVDGEELVRKPLG